jgi:tetratricopeptide (TPR) repeat protein
MEGPGATNPFRFREAYFLERKMFRSGEEYTGNPASYLRRGYSPANQQLPDSSDPLSYRFTWKLAIMLREVDHIARAGGLAEAEQLYLRFLDSVRRAQGQSTSDVAFVLGHLGNFYLEHRSFEPAYERFSEALDVRRKTLNSPTNLPEYRLHLADLLTHLGELEYGRNDLEQAEQHLAEAANLNNAADLTLYANRLDAAYFQSLSLEARSKWSDAEKVWQQAVASRTSIGNQPYSDACAEMAAFYARRGDFRAAAGLVRRTGEEIRGKPDKGAAPLPYWTDSGYDDKTPELYERLRGGALRQIRALDEWTRGATPEAVIQYFADPVAPDVLD